MEPQWKLYFIEFTCGASLTLKTCDVESNTLKKLLDFLPTRMCPECQLLIGDITPAELDILFSNDMQDFISSLRDEETDA